MKVTRWLMLAALSLGVSGAAAQERPGAEEEAERKNELGAFVGAVINLETDDTGPGFGFDYTRAMSERFGFGALVEWARAGNREAMFAGTIDWKPGGNIKFVFAPAVIVEQEDDDSRSAVLAFRTGFGYMLHVHHVPLTPSIYLDIVDSDERVDVHLVFGLTIEIPF